MNLQKLFETQAKLDEHIYEKHPDLRGQNNLDWKILALQVELGECANEWRGFKKWSNNQEPRTSEPIECFACAGTGDENYEWMQEAAEGNGGHEFIKCESCNGTGYDGTRNPLLEEYVDCLHFLLSIGLESKFDTLEILNEVEIETDISRDIRVGGIEHEFIFLGTLISDFALENSKDNFTEMFGEFVVLGEHLGFTWEQVESAYFAKNEINHKRQEAGY